MRFVTIVILALIPCLRAEETPKSFPASWEGVWKGACVNVRDGKTVLRFPMELHVARKYGTSDWTWQIVYGEGDKRQVRPYVLLPVDGEPNHWVIDEQNGILIDAYLENDRLHSRFQVGDSSLEVTYARRDDELDVTITTFGAQPVRTSGGEAKVAAYALRAVQRGTLER
jgi:hypothetical protein